MKLTPEDLFKRRGVKGEYPALAELVDATGDCWQWLGSTTNKGYGQVCIGGMASRAHRVFYEALIGEIPEGLVIDHLCRNPSCVFPDHLEPVTTGENTRRGFNAHRQKTHCPRGHAYDEANTHVLLYKDGRRKGRACRACAQIRAREESFRRFYESGRPLSEISHP